MPLRRTSLRPLRLTARLAARLAATSPTSGGGASGASRAGPDRRWRCEDAQRGEQPSGSSREHLPPLVFPLLPAQAALEFAAARGAAAARARRGGGGGGVRRRGAPLGREEGGQALLRLLEEDMLLTVRREVRGRWRGAAAAPRARRRPGCRSWRQRPSGRRGWSPPARWEGERGGLAGNDGGEARTRRAQREVVARRGVCGGAVGGEGRASSNIWLSVARKARALLSLPSAVARRR